MQPTTQGKINTVIISGNTELCSAFAAHDNVNIIAQFESIAIFNNRQTMEQADLLLIEATQKDHLSRLEAGANAVSKSTCTIVGLIDTPICSNEAAVKLSADERKTKHVKTFEKPWNYAEIMEYIRSSTNQHGPVRAAEDSGVGMRRQEHDDIIHCDDSGIAVFRRDQDCGDMSKQAGHPTCTTNRGKIISVVNPKGGVGKTFLSVNLACEIARVSEQEVALIDTNLGSCDMALHLDMLNARTITDMIPSLNDISASNLDQYIPAYQKLPIRVLLGPGTPEMCEFVELEHIKKLVDILAEQSSAVVIDTASNSFNMTTVDLLEISDRVVLLTTCELSSLQQARVQIHLMKRLGIAVEEKIHLIVNRLAADSVVSPSRIEDFLQLRIRGVLPEEPALVNQSIMRGHPLVMDSRTHPFKQDLQKVLSSVWVTHNQPAQYSGSEGRKSMMESIRSILFERKDTYGRRT